MPKNSLKKKQDEDPLFIDLLSTEDKVIYNELREEFSSQKYKNRRNRSDNVFKSMIQLISDFINRDKNDVWKRSLVCGIVWIKDMIIINTHQLRILIDKCKSSINGSFQSIGYEALPSGEEYVSHIISLYPFMKNNYSELRQWTARKLVNKNIVKKSVQASSKETQSQVLPKINSPNKGEMNSPIKISQDVYIQNPYDEISPAPDLTDINNNSLFSFSTGNDIMDQCENFQLKDNDLLNDDFLPFMNDFQNNENNEPEVKEYQNNLSFNDLNENLFL